jgi:hypothetical protein
MSGRAAISEIRCCRRPPAPRALRGCRSSSTGRPAQSCRHTGSSHGARCVISIARPTSTAGLTTAPANPDRFTQGEITGSWFTPGKGQDRIFVAYGAGTSFGATPLFNTFRLGGPLHLGALSNDQITGGNYAILDGGYLKRVTRLPDIIGGNVYIGSWLETGSAWNDWSSKDWHTNVSGGVIIESLIGPIFAGGSVGKGEGRFFISIGPLFK